MNKLIIVGLSSTANEVFDFVVRYSLFDVIGFAVNKEYRCYNEFHGKPVYELESIDSIIDKDKDYLFVAIQWNRLNADRRKVYNSLLAGGYQLANLISPQAIIHGHIEGVNCWISDMACLVYNVTIGNDVFVKSATLIGADTLICDHCFIGAHSTIGGGVIIGEQSFVGLGATIFDDVKVGKKCIVGAASALKRNLSDFTRYSVSTENTICKQYREDEIESKLLFSKNIR